MIPFYYSGQGDYGREYGREYGSKGYGREYGSSQAGYGRDPGRDYGRDPGRDHGRDHGQRRGEPRSAGPPDIVPGRPRQYKSRVVIQQEQPSRSHRGQPSEDDSSV